MNIDGMVHVNINCRNYTVSKAFYEMLGFREVWQVPETNTAEVANAVGMHAYRVRGALLSLRGILTIDLLEWQEPRSTSQPYATLYQAGIARLALRTSDIDADYQYLVSQGVEVLSEPATVKLDDQHGSRFFCFKDPDGTFLELVESY